MTGPTQLNLFTNHITLDNEYMRFDHKRQEMTKLLRTKATKFLKSDTFQVFPVVFGAPRTTPGCITEPAEEHITLTK